MIIDTEDAGTPFRFLTSFLSLQEGRQFVLTGSERLCERPIIDLVNALQSIGADISYLHLHGFAPLLIKGKKLTGNQVSIAGNISSQFISSLCLIAPLLADGLKISIEHHIVSDTYIQMTLACLHEFGIRYNTNDKFIHIPHQSFLARPFSIENDWSSAVLFYTMAMISNEADMSMDGLNKKSLQGDAFIQHIAKEFGIETQFIGNDCRIRKTKSAPLSFSKHFNLNAYPDLAVPFIVACALTYPQIEMSGIAHLELKESQRITALTNELKKINIELLYQNDLLHFIQPTALITGKKVNFHTYHDHRIAMALCMLTLKGYTVQLDDTECVQKSFPDFFRQADILGIKKVKQ
ncbi:3-phosphoshikimate 1-carboxyvinyltransferase [Filimonas sp.]|nr:3-phosphoshikimate 1-carboxyvinyltransferase [Filimonas sp.]